MSSDWQEYRLGDITHWASGGTPSKQNPEYWGGSIPWISASSMKAKVCANSDERITEEAVRSGARMCDPGTILLLVRGSELHKRIPIGVVTKRVAFNQDVKAITTCSGGLSGDYLYYLLKGSEEFLLNSVEFTGIGAGKLETPFLQDLVFPIPTRKEQALITDFMIALDDKIELNRKTNETLEAMAKALFKSWFVDFDPVRAKVEGRSTGLPAEISNLFPDSFEDSELGEIPSGWRVETVGDISSNFDSKRVPVSGNDREKRKGKYPYYGATGIVDWIDDYLFDGIHLLIGEDGSVERGDGTAFSQYVSGKIWVNNHAHVLTGAKDISTEHLYLYFQFIQVAPYVTGAVQLKISQGRLNSIPVLAAPPDINDCFSDLIRHLFDRKITVGTEVSTLGSLRDALLPKLISGEIRIPDAEKMLEEVGI